MYIMYTMYLTYILYTTYTMYIADGGIMYLVIYKDTNGTKFKEFDNRDEAVGFAYRMEGYVIENVIAPAKKDN